MYYPVWRYFLDKREHILPLGYVEHGEPSLVIIAYVVYVGADDWFSYDMPTTDTLGYDVADPLFGEPEMDVVYDSTLTMADDYGDLWAAPTYEDFEYDPATAAGVGTDAYAEDWTALEEAAAYDVEQTYGGNAETAAATFDAEYPATDSSWSWQELLAQGQDIYKLYAKLQQPAGATGPRPTLMRDPRTGQMVPAVRDPRTGQLVPAVRDPRTGMLVPASSIQQAGIIPGVPNTVLLVGAAVAAFMFFK